MRLCVACGQRLQGSVWVCERCGWSALVRDGICSLMRDRDVSTVRFCPQNFASLYELEQDYFWFRARVRLILWAFERYAATCRSFLEVGCGNGLVLSAISRTHPQTIVWGSEPHVEGLQFARTRLKPSQLLQMDARSIPFAEEFDAVGMFDVIEHIEEDEMVLAQASRALNPGGLLLITVPQHRFLWSAADTEASHVRRYSRAELVQKVERARFQVVRCTSFVSVLFPLLAVSRLCGSRRNHDAHAEYRIPRIVNKLFEFALSVERSAIRMGATLPFGGSLLLVARRVGA
jgi:SAM-dependent methyltransferase